MSTSDETDKFVTLVASLEGHEQVQRRVRKDVIQSESAFLKEYIDDGATEIKIPLKRPKNLNLILDYLYEGQLTNSNEIHLESLCNDAKILGLVNLQKVCVQRLTETISLDSWTQRLAFAQAEGCHELESNVVGFLDNNFEDCCRSGLASLSVDQMVQVLQFPTVKTTVTESNRIVIILDWIKANEVERCSQAHHLLKLVNFMKLTENTLRSFFDEEPALRNWRSVAIFERAIRLLKIQEAARQSLHGQTDESERIEVNPAAFEASDNRLTMNIKQEVVAYEESSNAEVNESNGTMNTEDSARECRIRMKREVSPPLPSAAGETIESVESNEDGPSPQKIPRQKCSQNEIESVVPSPPKRSGFVTQQKQILYFSQLSNGARCLNSVIISTDSISQPQQVLASLPKYMSEVPKLIWNKKARNVCFLGLFGPPGRNVPFFNYMNNKGAPKVTLLPKMLHRRHHRYQPVLMNDHLYVFGGSRIVSYENKGRFSSAEVLDMTAASRRTCQWQPITSMATKRDLYAAACVEGNIYVTGGAIDRPTGSEPLITNHVLCYSPGENRWEELQSMRNFRCGHASAVLGQKIYVFGGSGKNYNDSSKDHVNMKSTEVYDIEGNKWTLIAPMRRPRYGGSAVEIEGKIYVIGGDQSNQGENPSSVECYDPLTNTWTFVSETVEDEGVFDSITVIDDPEYFLKGS